MKIAYFTDTFLPSINGVITSLVNITDALAERGHEIVIFAPSPGRKHKTRRNSDSPVRIEYLPSLPASLIYPGARLAPPLTWGLLEKLRSFHPDVLHLHTVFTVGTGSIILGKTLKIPLVGTFHGYFMEPEYLKMLGLDQIGIVSDILWNYATTFFNQCDTVLTPSEFTGKDIRQHGIKKPIVVIPNSINEEKIHKVDEKILKSLQKKYRLKKNVILYVGRVSQEKSIDILIKSFYQVLQKVPDSSLLIIGDGPVLDDLKELANSLHLQSHVIFTGAIPQERLLTKGYFQLADIFATASTSEVQPVSLIEAMYFGLPIIGVNERGVKEMVSRVGTLGKANDIDQLSSNIIKTLTNEQLKQQLISNSRHEFERKYALSKITDEFERLYKKIARV